MCELMGLCFAQPISADFSIREFALRSDENADGWGLGWYPDQSLAIVKEPVRWQASPYTGFLESYPHLQACVYVFSVITMRPAIRACTCAMSTSRTTKYAVLKTSPSRLTWLPRPSTTALWWRLVPLAARAGSASTREV